MCIGICALDQDVLSIAKLKIFARLKLFGSKEEADDDRRKEEFVPGNSGWPGA